ncbi:MAG: PDZ domain-containing protein [Ferruginibacter sp.]
MKRNITLGIIGWLLSSLGGYKTMAQEAPSAPEKKETQEVIIRKKGNKDTKLTVEITGDKVLINGKPLVEFNEDGVTINNRKMIVREGNKIMMDFDGKMLDLNDKLKELEGMKIFNFNFTDDDMHLSEGKGYTYMGVNTDKTEEGFKITNVSKGSPAEKAGLKKDDIIYEIDGVKLDSKSSLSDIIRAKKAGDKVKVEFIRDGKKKDEKVILGTQKNSMAKTFSYNMPDGSRKSLTIPRAPRPPGGMFGEDDMFDGNGFNVFERRQKLGLKIQDTEEGNGVKVLEVEAASAAATAGIMKDDVITEIGGMKINNTDDAREQLQENKDKSSYGLKAKRSGTEMMFTVKIPKKLKSANL